MLDPAPPAWLESMLAVDGSSYRLVGAGRGPKPRDDDGIALVWVRQSSSTATPPCRLDLDLDLYLDYFWTSTKSREGNTRRKAQAPPG